MTYTELKGKSGAEQAVIRFFKGLIRRLLCDRVTVMSVSVKHQRMRYPEYIIHNESKNRVYVGQNKFGYCLTVHPADEKDYFRGKDICPQWWSHWKHQTFNTKHRRS